MAMTIERIRVHRQHPLSRQTISDALDRATAHLCRADNQFNIPGPRQKDHWESALRHLTEARGALEEAAGVLESSYVALYGATPKPAR